MQRLAVVGTVENREWMERIVRSHKSWKYTGHYDPKTNQAYIPGSSQGIPVSFDVFLKNNESLFFLNNQALSFNEIEFALKHSKNVFIENLYSLEWEKLQRINKLLSEVRSTCMAGTITHLPVHEWTQMLPPVPPRIIHIERGMELHAENIHMILAEFIELIYQMIHAECRRTDAVNIQTLNYRFNTLDATIRFSNASLAHILIHPPYPREEYKLAVYQNNGLMTTDLVGKTLFAMVEQYEFSHKVIELSRTEKIVYYLDAFFNAMNTQPSPLQLMEQITPMEILHSLLSKIKHISVQH